MTKLEALKQQYIALGEDPKDVENINTISEMVVKIAEWQEEHGGGGTITVDDELSETSKNPVQNKVMTAAINAKADKSEVQTDVQEAVETAVEPAVQEAVQTAVPKAIDGNKATDAEVDDAISNLDDL